MTISLDRVDVADRFVTVAWTRRSPGLPGGQGRGANEFTLGDGEIARLATRFLRAAISTTTEVVGPRSPRMSIRRAPNLAQ